MSKPQATGRWVFWSLMAVLLAVVVFLTFRPEPVWVDLAEARVGDLDITITEEGKTRVRDRYQVSSPVAGYQHRVLLNVGDLVSPGQLLTEVDPMPASVLDARSRAEAEALVGAALSALNSVRQKAAAAEAEAGFATKELVRLQALKERRFISDEQLQQAEVEALRAQAILRSARFDVEVMAHELSAAKTRLEVSAAQSSGNGFVERVAVRSPLSGAVLSVVRKSEGVIGAGDTIVEIGDPRALEVVVEVLSFDAVQLNPGVAVRLSGWGGPTLEAMVRRVEPVGFEDVSALGVEEQRVRVLADIVSPPEQWQALGDGYRVDAAFLLWSGQDVLRVPASAVQSEGAGSYVFRFEEGRAVLTPVTLGRSNGLYTVVDDGLSESDLVVRHPDRQLESGARVRER